MACGTAMLQVSITTTSVEMICALGLVVITPQPAKYHHYGTAFFRDFFCSMIIDNYMAISNNNQIKRRGGLIESII
jgi:hypothetical protein